MKLDNVISLQDQYFAESSKLLYYIYDKQIYKFPVDFINSHHYSSDIYYISCNNTMNNDIPCIYKQYKINTLKRRIKKQENIDTYLNYLMKKDKFNSFMNNPYNLISYINNNNIPYYINQYNYYNIIRNGPENIVYYPILFNTPEIELKVVDSNNINNKNK